MKADTAPTRTQESVALAKIAGPLIISYVADSLSFIVAKAVVGKLGFLELAAVGVSADLAFQATIVMMGFFSVVGVLVAEALGARRRQDIVLALMQGLWLSLAAGGLITAYVWNLGVALQAARQAPEVIAAAEPFYRHFAFAMLPSVMFAAMRGFVAAMVRVSYWMGARSRAAARQAGNLGMILGVGVPLLLVVIPLTAPNWVMGFFLDPADKGYAEVSALVAGLLIIGAVFQIFDGLQAIASHALRGLRDAKVPLVIAGIGYWAIGLAASYVFAFTFGWGARGLWWGVALGLGFTAALLAWRFERLSR